MIIIPLYLSLFIAVVAAQFDSNDIPNLYDDDSSEETFIPSQNLVKNTNLDRDSSLALLQDFLANLPDELKREPVPRPQTLNEGIHYLQQYYEYGNQLGNRYGQTQQSGVLEYKPQRPWYAGAPKPYPQPIIRPPTPPPNNLGDRFGQTTTSSWSQSTSGSWGPTTGVPLGQNHINHYPGRPPFAGVPKPYPEPIMRPQNPHGSNLGDRYGEHLNLGSDRTTPSTITARPPCTEVPKPQPKPTIRPQNSHGNQLGDKYGQTSSLGSDRTTASSVPGRPPFAGKPKPYPEPIIRPQTVEGNFGDRFGTNKPTTKPDFGFGIDDADEHGGSPFTSKPKPPEIIKPTKPTRPLTKPNLEESSTSGRPPFAGKPNQYPEQVKPITNLEDRFRETTTTTKPSGDRTTEDSVSGRPPLAGNSKPYPEQVKPQTTTNVGDNFRETTTYGIDRTTPSSVAGRPPFAGKPKPYPEQENSKQTTEVGDRLGETTTHSGDRTTPSSVSGRPPFTGKPKPNPEEEKPKQTTEVGDRLGETTTHGGDSTTPSSVPGRPPFAGKPKPYPEQVKPQQTTEFGDRYGETTTHGSDRTTPSSVTGRPPFAGKPKPYPEEEKPKQTTEVGDRLGETTTHGGDRTTPSTTPSSVTGRPPFAGKPKPYPEQVKPQQTTEFGDRYGETTSHTSSIPNNFEHTHASTTKKPLHTNKPIELGYKPERPFYAGKPKPYPEQVKPQQTTEFGNRFEETTTRGSDRTTPSSVSGRPPFGGKPKPHPEHEKPHQTTEVGDRFGESTTTKKPMHTDKPIELGYKPQRPFYAGKPKPYPEQTSPPTTSPLDERYGSTTTPQSTFTSTTSKSTTPYEQYFEDFRQNLQALYDYVIELQKRTSTPSYKETSSANQEVTTGKNDLNKIAEAIKPLLTTTTRPSEEW